MNHWKLAAASGWLAFGLVVAMGADKALTEVRAKRFVLVGDDGAELIVMESSKGRPSLELIDARNEMPRLTLGLWDNGFPEISMSDGAGNEIMNVTGWADGPKLEYKINGGKIRKLP